MQKLVDLDESNFASEIQSFDGLTVVEFYAPWCRTCRAVAPTFERLVARMSAEEKYDSVRFFKVNFKANKQLSLRERVFALPAVHFYTPTLGRINRFTLSTATAAKKLRSEVDRYAGDSGHLALLKDLQTKPNALSALVKFNLLAAFVQALVNADTYLEKADNEDGEYLADVMSGDNRRIEQLEQLFSWIDANGDGYIDSGELSAVALAVGMGSGGLGGEGEGKDSDVLTFYTALLEAASASVASRAEDGMEEADDATEDEAPRPALSFASFVRLMTSKAVTEWKTPETELQPAFRALDENNDGVITKEEMLRAMEVVGKNLPGEVADEWAQEAAVAFDALDRDKSGTLDYEEFVAVMSGMRTSPYAAE